MEPLAGYIRWQSKILENHFRRLYYFCLLVILLVAGACNSSNSQVPTTLPVTVIQTGLPTASATATPFATTVSYYVDSSLGNDANSCALAQNPSTPKKTVSGIMFCNPGPGETVRFRGEFKETISPTRSGALIYDVQDIIRVDGSSVMFKQTITKVNPGSDYVAIYGSRRGNSGAFAILSSSGNRVIVDTSNLPSSQFISEAASDPGVLQAAILRPIHFTAWDKQNPPVWSGLYQTYHVINQSVIMVSYLKSVAGEKLNPGYLVWPAFEIDGNNQGNSNFQIFDHLEVTNAASAIAVEANEFQSNYDIFQFNNLHEIGSALAPSDEIIYFGFAYRPDLHHDYVQIVYNKIGPHNLNSNLGDGVEIKPSAHNATLFGNEIVDINAQGCSDAPIKIAGTNAFIANNYIHDINPQASQGCGISIVDDEPSDPASGGEGAIVANNILANIKGVGIKVVDASGVQVVNNTVYNILPEPDCDSWCMEENMGIEIHNWQGPIENMVIKNNIVQKAYIGIGRYVGSHNEFPINIDSDYNIVFDVYFAFRGTIISNTHDLVSDPRLVDPENFNFALMAISPARDSGIGLAGVFDIDNHDAADPTLPAIIAPIIRIGVWDRGAYEYK